MRDNLSLTSLVVPRPSVIATEVATSRQAPLTIFVDRRDLNTLALEVGATAGDTETGLHDLPSFKRGNRAAPTNILRESRLLPQA